MKILQNEINGTQTSFSTNFDGGTNFILCFFFPERLHCSSAAVTYIFTVPTCTTIIITLEPCALGFGIPFWDLIKFPYFADTTQSGNRGWKQAQGLRRGWRQGDFTDVWVNILESFWRNKHKVCGWDLWQHTQNKRLFTCVKLWTKYLFS